MCRHSVTIHKMHVAACKDGPDLDCLTSRNSKKHRTQQNTAHAHAQEGAPLNSRSAVRTATPLAEYKIVRTTLLYAMGRPSASAATSRRLPPAWVDGIWRQYCWQEFMQIHANPSISSLNT